jgi:gliding motility-associated-like protein
MKEMKDIKSILDNHSEQPSEQVWQRLSERLDAEMPVNKTLVREKSIFWKWAAVVMSLVTIGGITFGVIRYHHNNQVVTTQNTAENTDNEAVDNTSANNTVEVAVVENIVPQAVTETVPMESTHAQAPADKADRASASKQSAEEETKPTVQPAPKTNVRQEVLPPNSTLAKQLAADPVLRTLSDDNVDWSLPTHLSIPNIFTPNNDGVNDFFVIEGLENYTAQRLVVRDKNNRIVYQSGAYANNWGGENCPDGVYNYELTFSYNGIENQATGKVRIMRS